MQNDLADISDRRTKRTPLLDRPSVIRAVVLGILLAAAISAVLLVDFLSPSQVILNAGDVSPETILAPADKTYISAIQTERARENQARKVQPIYDPADGTIRTQQEDRARDILAYISTVRQDTYASVEEKVRWIAAIPDLQDLPPTIINRALSLNENDWQEVAEEIVDVLLEFMEGTIQEDDLDAIRGELPNRIRGDLDFAQRSVIEALASRLVKANALYNAAKTEEERQKAREIVDPVSVTIREGEAIIREGDLVTAEDIEELNAFGLRQQARPWGTVAGTILFSLIVVLILELLALRLQPTIWARWRTAVATIVLVATFVALGKLMLPVKDEVISYLYPLPALSMILTVLFGPSLGITAGVTAAFVGAFVAGGSLELTAYLLAGTLMGALVLGEADQLKVFLRAGLAVALTNALVIILFGLVSPDQDMVKASINALVGVVMGGLAASLTLAAFFGLSATLELITPFQLMELSRPTHPLFRRLLLEAPGTYHHTLLVSNMAEEAANRIGANGMLARVGSYYHDVGKTLRPAYFTENQEGGVNPHEMLDPFTSAKIIISHVHDGQALAEKYGLPAAIRDFIPQHQGDDLVRAFYRKAVTSAGDGGASVREEDFRYPGPKPQSKEAAIVMLADSCEARTRSAQSRSPDEIDLLIRATIKDKLDTGQLDEVDLTLRDLDQIREAFVSVLQGVFHPRTQYPEPVVVRGADGQTVVR